MSKILLSLSMALCCVIFCNSTAKAMLSEREEADIRKQISQCKNGSGIVIGRSHTVQHKGSSMAGYCHETKCLTCEDFKNKLLSHERAMTAQAALSSQKAKSDAEEAELRKQLMKAQIAALQRK